MRKVTAMFCVIIGTAMIGLWGMLLGTGNVPELETEPFAIAFHLLAEIATAVILLVSGYGIFAGRKWSSKLFPLSMGALFYTVINSAGFYAQSGDFAMVIMFAFIAVTASVLTSLWFKEVNHG